MEKKFQMDKTGTIHIQFENKEIHLKDEQSHTPLATVSTYFSNVIGMHDMIKIIKEIYAVHIVNTYRKEFGLRTDKQMLHMVFSGNPGTGKTTVARIIAQLYKDLHILPKGHLIECDRAAIVGEYIGETAQKTNQMIDKAQGGVLFIDEAYSLARGGNKDFGKEAIDTLVKRMEDQYEAFALILAGYTKEMKYLLSMNAGLSSRIAYHHTFHDYPIDQLLAIAEKMLTVRQYILTTRAKQKLKQKIIHEKTVAGERFANGRAVRNMIESIIRKQAMRIVHQQNKNREQLMEIMVHDID